MDTIGSGQQLSNHSWWPKRSTWEKSLFNVGCWTPLAEQWFQQRLAEIRSGKACSKTASEWYKSLPRRGKPLKLAVTVERASKLFIERHSLL
jgi:hypothetical protein